MKTQMSAWKCKTCGHSYDGPQRACPECSKVKLEPTMNVCTKCDEWIIKGQICTDATLTQHENCDSPWPNKPTPSNAMANVLAEIARICEACGHTQTEDGCAFCIKNSAIPPKIVCLCGSSRFVGDSAVKAWELNKQGIATFMMPLLPQWYPGVKEHHQAEAEGVADNLDKLWLKLIAIADEVFVVNCGGYIGERTQIEINHAKALGKTINYLEPI